MFKLFVITLATVAATQAFAAECSKKAAEAKVNEVCKSIEEKGAGAKSAWPDALKYENCGANYVWVQDKTAEVKMIFHPILPRLNDTAIGEKITDEKGTKIFPGFVKIANENKAGGWTKEPYYWKKPGAEVGTAKIAFVKTCKSKSGEDWIAGSGIWQADLK